MPPRSRLARVTPPVPAALAAGAPDSVHAPHAAGLAHPTTSPRTSRRALLAWPAVALLSPAWASETVRDLLRRGAAVIAFRHALAPGTFDPEGFRLGDCRTQRNLDDEGRAQARRIGAWFREQGLVPAQVRSSPWCRCIDTATLAFGRAEAWPALSSPHGSALDDKPRRMAELRAALARVPTGRFEAWVTHQFVLQDLAGTPTQPGEALVLRATAVAAGSVQVLARAVLH